MIGSVKSTMRSSDSFGAIFTVSIHSGLPQVDCNESRELLIWHLFDRSWLNHLASLCAMAKLTGRFVCLEPSAHDVAEGAVRGQAVPGVEAELLVNPYSAEIRIRSLRLDSDPCDG